MELPDLSKRIVQNGRGSGWLCRVIQPGTVAANALLQLVQPHPARLSIARLWQLTIGTAHDTAALAEASQLDVLAPAWRNRLQSRQRLLEKRSR
jgi:MOSC domain-containing protein YiiM